MATSSEIKQRAKALAEKTDVNSITPKEVGEIMYDLASHSENVLRNGGTLGIRKVYESVAAMEADSTNPKDLWGEPLKKGNLVVIYDGTSTGVDNNKIYAFMKPGWQIATHLDAGYATKASLDAAIENILLQFRDSENALNESIGNLEETVTGNKQEVDAKLSELGSKVDNLSDYAEAFDGSNYNELGLIQGQYIGEDGNLYPHKYFYTTDYIPLENNNFIYIKGVYFGGGAVIFYSENKDINYANQGQKIAQLIDEKYGFYKIKKEGGSWSKYVRLSFCVKDNIADIRYSNYLNAENYPKKITKERLDDYLFNTLDVLNTNIAKKYPIDKKTYDYYINDYNEIYPLKGFMLTDFIKVEGLSLIVSGIKFGGGGINFYDSEKKFIEGHQSSKYAVALKNNTYKISIPKGAIYIRFSGVETTDELNYVFGDSVNEELTKYIYNIKNKELYPLYIKKYTQNAYYDISDGKINNDNYSYIEYDVKNISCLNIRVKCNQNTNIENLYSIIGLDENENIIKTNVGNIESKEYDVKGVAKIIVNFSKGTIPFVLSNASSYRKNNYRAILTDDSIHYFGDDTYITKNICISVCFKVLESFSRFFIARGNPTVYHQAKLTITKNQISNDSIIENLPFTILPGNIVKITITNDDCFNYKIKIVNGEHSVIYNQFDFFAYGSLFMTSNGVEILHSSISYIDSNRDVYFYGDSYVSANTYNRWPIHAADIGAKFFLHGFPGADSHLMIKKMLEDVSRYGKPKAIVWGLGMNDNSDDNENKADSVWDSYIKELHRFCNILGIKFIPCTIPNVPERFHGGKNNYIKSNYSEYIDFNYAVDNTVDYNWIEGTLGNDRLHPNENGAFLLAMQAINDCPMLLPK